MKNEDLSNAIIIADEILNWIKQLQSHQPYNFNVIDELHANENAHSRILCKLLQYRNSEGHYTILESFLSYISKTTPEFRNIHIVKPIITQEEERIDLWIRDYEGEYAVILENKVMGAMDQDAQLSRYIDKTLDHNFNINHIYIVYLPGDDHEPSNKSWGSRKKEFENRYIKLSFRDDIIDWLENEILPNCTLKEDLLSSAIKQYIDHLKGLFKKRPSQIKSFVMNKELLKKIGITGNTFNEQLPQLNEIIEKLGKAQEEIINYRTKFVHEVMNTFTKCTLDILGNDWKINDKIRTNNGWYFLYNTNWKSNWYIHLEWSNIKIEDLFTKVEYKIVLHAEGDYKNNPQTNELCKELGFMRGGNSTTLWQKVFIATKPLGSMNESEMRDFLISVYKSNDINRIVETIDRLMVG